MWYMNLDSGLYVIAYSNPGASQLVLPKTSVMTFERLKHLIKTIGTFPGSFDEANSLYQLTDTIQDYTPTRKVLTYPLTIGARWIEFTFPFFKERFIQKKEIVNTNSGSYNCYKLETNWNWSNFEFNDYVDLKAGLILREIIADSLPISSVTTIDPDTVGFYKYTLISKLVREKK